MYKLKDPLPRAEWTIETPFHESVTIGGLTLNLLGMTASHPDFGAIQASSVTRDSESHTAEFELIERLTILIQMHDQPDIFPGKTTELYRPARSNGIALHKTWDKACERAAMELVERHALLESWLGRRKPERIKSPVSFAPALMDLYTCEAYQFGEVKVSFAAQTMKVVMVVLWPKKPEAPLVFGFGTGYELTAAQRKAESESLQRLGFLWGEDIPTELPTYEASQYYHSEFYLYPPNHQILRGWLDGVNSSETKPGPQVDFLKVEFLDITTRDSAPFVVAKATAKEALPLYFGRYLEGPFASLRETAREVHPIP